MQHDSAGRRLTITHPKPATTGWRRRVRWTRRGYTLQPLVTDDTGTQGEGGKQFEAAYIHAQARDGGAMDHAHSMPFVLTYGMTDALDIAASVSQHRINPHSGRDENGIGNIVLGAKSRFYENDTEKLSFAVKPEIALPVSASNEARGLGTGKYFLRIIVAGRSKNRLRHFYRHPGRLPHQLS